MRPGTWRPGPRRERPDDRSVAAGVVDADECRDVEEVESSEGGGEVGAGVARVVEIDVAGDVLK